MDNKTKLEVNSANPIVRAVLEIPRSSLSEALGFNLDLIDDVIEEFGYMITYLSKDNDDYLKYSWRTYLKYVDEYISEEYVCHTLNEHTIRTLLDFTSVKRAFNKENAQVIQEDISNILLHAKTNGLSTDNKNALVQLTKTYEQIAMQAETRTQIVSMFMDEDQIRSYHLLIDVVGKYYKLLKNTPYDSYCEEIVLDLNQDKYIQKESLLMYIKNYGNPTPFKDMNPEISTLEEIK